MKVELTAMIEDCLMARGERTGEGRAVQKASLSAAGTASQTDRVRLTLAACCQVQHRHSIDFMPHNTVPMHMYLPLLLLRRLWWWLLLLWRLRLLSRQRWHAQCPCHVLLLQAVRRCCCCCVL